MKLDEGHVASVGAVQAVDILGWRLDIDGFLFFPSVWGGMDVTHHLQTCHPKGARGSGDDVQYVGSLSRLPKIDNMLR
jgi:hypothetical protein